MREVTPEEFALIEETALQMQLAMERAADRARDYS